MRVPTTTWVTAIPQITARHTNGKAVDRFRLVWMDFLRVASHAHLAGSAGDRDVRPVV